MTPAAFRPLLAVLRRLPPWLDAVFVAALCLAVSLTAPGDWRPSLDVPFFRGADSMSATYFIKTVVEHGWYTVNPDVGAPFGANMYDYPVPEPTHFLLIRALGFFSHDPFVLFNLFYFLSFLTTAVSAWWALRYLGIGRPLAAAGAFLFAILPYHFLRQGHLYLMSYFAVPIFAAYAMKLALHDDADPRANVRLTLGTLALLAVAAGAGVYYAFFGCLFIAAGALAGAARSWSARPFGIGAVCIAVIAGVIGMSLVPSAVYRAAEGANSAVAQRLWWESEIYGLKIAQLLLPTIGHRLDWLGGITKTYNASAPLVTENFTAALGLIGSAGLIGAVLASLFGARWRGPQAIAAAGALSIVGILIGTIGGLGALFAFFVTPEIRGLNRISVFIAFFSIVSALLLVRHVLGSRPLIVALAAVVLMAIGWIDEIPVKGLIRTDAATFRSEQTFLDTLQQRLPAGTAVYELPYVFFPESPKVQRLGSYDLLEPYLRTRGLRWSFGGMRGRASDLWNEQASTLEGSELISALAGAGFGAIYVDRRGYADRGAKIEQSLSKAVGAPMLEDPNRNVAVYRIPADTQALPFVVVGAGRGWYPWKRDARGSLAGEAQGSVDLVVANPTAAPVPVAVEFDVVSTGHRRLEARYEESWLADFVLEPNARRPIRLSFVARPGVSRLALDTDSPAERSGADLKKVAYRLENLSYEAALR